MRDFITKSFSSNALNNHATSQLSNWLTDSTGQSHSRVASSTSVIRDVLHTLRNQVYHRVHKRPSPARVLSQINLVPALHLIFWRSILILYSHLSIGLQSGLFPSGFSTNHCTNLSTSPLLRSSKPVGARISGPIKTESGVNSSYSIGKWILRECKVAGA